MPKKNKPREDEGILVSAAKSIGKAAGTIAAASGLAPKGQLEARPKKPSGRLAATNKARWPRRQKKAQKKSAREPRSAAL